MSSTDRRDEVGDLLGGAYGDGSLSRETMEALTRLPNVGQEIADGLGEPDRAAKPEVLLVTILGDDSGSISGREQDVRAGHNLLLEALGTEVESADILVHTRLLNAGLISAYQPLGRAVRLTAANYDPAHFGGTPLYDQAVLTLGSVLAKTRQLEGQGRRVRTFTLLITDGRDAGSTAASAQSVAWVVGDMLLSGAHIVAGMGIGEDPVFRNVFEEMGLKPGWILTSDSTAADIRATFRTLGESMALAASGEAGFLELNAGPKAGL